MKNFREEFLLGLSAWFQSWSFIFRNRLVHYFLYPIVISILMGMGAIVLIHRAAGWIVGLVSPYFVYEPLPAESGFWSTVLQVLSDISSYAVSFIIWILLGYVSFRIKKYVVLALMSPMMSLLSERTSEILTGATYKFNGQQFVKDIVRGVLLTVRNFLVETGIGFCIWIATLFLSLAGGIGVIISPLVLVITFCVGAYFYGFSTIDYNNERNRLPVRASIRLVRSHKGLAVGNGTMFNLLMLLPFFGATIATVTCTVAATLALHQAKVQFPDEKIAM